MTWKKIAEKNTIAPNRGEEFDIDSKKIAIFNQDGYHALDALCVHQDTSIATGKLDGSDMNVKAHFDKKYRSLKIFGATEETTAGVNRIRAVEKQGKLRYPVISVNDAYTKHMYEFPAKQERLLYHPE